MKIVVLDVETIPDLAAMERCGYKPGAEFAPWPLHELACASVLIVTTHQGEPIGHQLRSYSRGAMSERGIVAAIDEELEGANLLVTYNGQAFDLPVLINRATIAQQPVPNLLRMARRDIMFKHRDLHEDVRCGGPGISLAHLCAPLGIPAKTGGSSVLTLAEAGQWSAIEYYCETDVIATWIALQLWDYRGAGDEGYRRWQWIAEWISLGGGSPNPRLQSFVDGLRFARQAGGPMLGLPEAQPPIVL